MKRVATFYKGDFMQSRLALYAVLALMVVCTVIHVIGFGVFGKQTDDDQKMYDTDFAKGCKENRCFQSFYETRYYTINQNSPTRIPLIFNLGLGKWSINTQGQLGTVVIKDQTQTSADLIYTPDQGQCGIDCFKVQCQAQGTPNGIAVLPVQIQIRAPY